MKKIILIVLILAGLLFGYYLTFISSDTPSNTQAVSTPEQHINAAKAAPNNALRTKNSNITEATDAVSLDEHGYQDTKPEHTPVQEETEESLGAFLSSSEQKSTLSTAELKNYSVDKFRQSIANLDNDSNKNNLAIETEYALERKLSYIPEMTFDTVRCSASMCGLMFSGSDKESISKTLDQLSRDDELGSLSGGGYLRHIEEDGIHYGVMVLVFKGDYPLSIN